MTRTGRAGAGRAGAGPAALRPDPSADILHASCVVLGRAGVLILGPSGSGKSALALRLMALGFALVADDRVALTANGGAIEAAAPPGLPAMIEARGIGLLAARLAPPSPIVLAVDLGRTETDRLPPRRVWSWRGISVDCVHGPATGHFPAAIVQYIRLGRAA
ncbi:MAG: HPr kinase/phosphorylase [Gemmobacter sp.]